MHDLKFDPDIMCGNTNLVRHLAITKM